MQNYFLRKSKKSLEVWIIFPYLCFEILKRRGGLVVHLVLKKNIAEARISVQVRGFEGKTTVFPKRSYGMA